jgi:Bacterial Ig-like domain
MLRGTRENTSFLALISNSAGVAVLCFLLLASTVVAVIPQPNLHSTMLSSAYAQEAGDTEGDTGTETEGDTGTETEGDTGTETEGDTGTETEGGEISDEEQVSTEEDTTAPTVTDTEPADEATDVAATITSINATFSEAVQGVDDTTFTLSQGDDTLVEGTVTYDSQSNTTTFTPSSDLQPGTTYTATLNSGITDLTDNPLEATQWSFTTSTEEVSTEEVPPGEVSTEEVSPGGTDQFGVDELYATASSGPTWYISEQNDPTTDGHFYLSMYQGTTIGYAGSGVWNVDATSGTQEHGIRMHVDSPTGTWKNTEMTGYFRANSGSDQFTMIARHGPSYHDDNGCLAYGYYGMTAVDGNVFFKKKLYHFNDGYTKRLAQSDALNSLGDGRWIGMKFVVYDLPNGDVKLELWIDDGDMTNNWEKVTELTDTGNLAVEGGDDCGRSATDQIDSGTRVTYRVDNMDFDFKKLSVREIQAANGAASPSSAEPQDEGTSAEGEEAASSSAEPQDEGTSSDEQQDDVSAEETLSTLENSLGFGSLTR